MPIFSGPAADEALERGLKTVQEDGGSIDLRRDGQDIVLVGSDKEVRPVFMVKIMIVGTLVGAVSFAVVFMPEVLIRLSGFLGL